MIFLILSAYSKWSLSIYYSLLMSSLWNIWCQNIVLLFIYWLKVSEVVIRSWNNLLPFWDCNIVLTHNTCIQAIERMLRMLIWRYSTFFIDSWCLVEFSQCLFSSEYNNHYQMVVYSGVRFSIMQVACAFSIYLYSWIWHNPVELGPLGLLLIIILRLKSIKFPIFI